MSRRLQETGQARYRGRVNLRDPSFTLAEVLDDAHSPLRQCLPGGERFYDQLARVRNIRNKWQHFNHLPDIGVLARDLNAVRGVAAAVDLDRLVGELDAVVGALRDVPRVQQLTPLSLLSGCGTNGRRPNNRPRLPHNCAASWTSCENA